MGLDSDKEQSRQARETTAAELRVQEKEKRKMQIKSSPLYQFVIRGKIVKDLADGVLSFVEGVGDVLTLIIGLVNIYCCATVVRSFRLTVAVTVITGIDFLVGLIPVAGSVVDLLFPSNHIAGNLIEDYVEGTGNAKTKATVIATVGVVILAGIGYGVYFLLTTMYDNIAASF